MNAHNERIKLLATAIVAARKPAELLGEPVSVEAPEPPDYEAATAHFRTVIARKLRK